jgi:hypothetical protein
MIYGDLRLCVRESGGSSQPYREFYRTSRGRQNVPASQNPSFSYGRGDFILYWCRYSNLEADTLEIVGLPIRIQPREPV